MSSSPLNGGGLTSHLAIDGRMVTPGVIVLDEDRFTGDPLAQPAPEHDFDQPISW
jgi:hypothetical protein